MVNAHDLLWGMTPAHAPADAPAWVLEALGAGHPVVVRRAIAAPGHVAVGVRGRLREQRFAAEMPLAAVQRRVAPEALRDVVSLRDIPALQALLNCVRCWCTRHGASAVAQALNWPPASKHCMPRVIWI